MHYINTQNMMTSYSYFYSYSHSYLFFIYSFNRHVCHLSRFWISLFDAIATATAKFIPTIDDGEVYPLKQFISPSYHECQPIANAPIIMSFATKKNKKHLNLISYPDLPESTHYRHSTAPPSRHRRPRLPFRIRQTIPPPPAPPPKPIHSSPLRPRSLS